MKSMQTRKIVINIHMVLASFFLPLLLMMPFTGGMYLLGFKGEQKTTESFRVLRDIPVEEEERMQFFREQFDAHQLDFDFEYIASSGSNFTFRPSSRVHYVASKVGSETIVSKVEPNLLKRMIELHKGHGPKLMKRFQMIFGLALILVTFSGLWLAVTIPAYRKITFISFGLGAALIAFCLI